MMDDSSKEDLNGYRLVKVITFCGRKVLYKIFLCGTQDKLPNMTLKDYLISLQRENVLKIFNNTQNRMIDKNTDGSLFDVSLLYLSIKVACKDVAPYNDQVWFTPSAEMEYYITAIKNMRNDFLHGQLTFTDEDYFKHMKKLREVLTGCLKTSGERYGLDDTQVVKDIMQMDDDLDRIMNEILGEDDILTYCSDEMKSLMINDSCHKLKEIFQSLSYVYPVSFITNDLQLKVDQIFVELEVTQGKRGGEGEHIDHRDLLRLIQTTAAPSSTSNDSQQQYQTTAAPSSTCSDSQQQYQTTAAPSSTSIDSQQQYQTTAAPSSTSIDSQQQYQTTAAPSSTSTDSQQQYQTTAAPSSTSTDSQQQYQTTAAPSSTSIDSQQQYQTTAAPSSTSTDSQQQYQTTAAPSSTSIDSQQHITSTRPQILLLEGLAGSGKTTLTKLIIDEWIKDGRGNIYGLDNYELLLWVQCRDPTMTSYQELLERLIPDVSIKFRKILPRLMKLCKLLIIVDGLDEDNQNSRNLINSLLHEFNYCSHIAFLCTSRPEKVDNFRKTIPKEYSVKHALLHGIYKEKLVKFVHLNHQQITKQTGNNRNTEELVRKVKDLKGLDEHLRLPMNLIVMIYIWDHDPDKLNLTSVTHTELYHNIHDLCKERLIERLLSHDDTKNVDVRDLKSKVNQILINIYKTALESLACDQLTLEVETVDNLITACKQLCLPHKEVLSAFLCLRPTWTFQGIKERYSTPHKGIQDYFAALYIVRNLINNSHYSTSTITPATPATRVGILRVLKQSVRSVGGTSTVSIKKVLKQTVRSANVDMSKYQNVLVHVAGLLYLLLEQIPKAPAREVANLLRKSGMKDNEDWLSLLENTKISPVTAKEISPFFNIEQTINVKDNRVRSYTALLPHLRSCEVMIDIQGDPGVLPDLPDLLGALTNHHCTYLRLQHHYYHAETTITSDNLLQVLQSRNHLEVFRGYLTGTTTLEDCTKLRRLHLAVVSDDHARCLLPQLHHTVTSALPQLEWLSVRVAASVSPAALMSLPSTQRVALELTGVSDTIVSHACDVAQELQPPGGYWVIWCRPSTVTEEGIQDMISSLHHHTVNVVYGLTVLTSATITQQQQHQLVTMAQTTLNCELTIYANSNESDELEKSS
ncbi:hypothetical protein OTU49_010327 [Cherax quadricarinatus]|uniref:NACHT domain-containing protein n=1 Tax=Cherax quadricarinatus TaxID=27406 RepID=A0AAW0W8Y7_CHEQU